MSSAPVSYAAVAAKDSKESLQSSTSAPSEVATSEISNNQSSENDVPETSASANGSSTSSESQSASSTEEPAEAESSTESQSSKDAASISKEKAASLTPAPVPKVNVWKIRQESLKPNQTGSQSDTESNTANTSALSVDHDASTTSTTEPSSAGTSNASSPKVSNASLSNSQDDATFDPVSWPKPDENASDKKDSSIASYPSATSLNGKSKVGKEKWVPVQINPFSAKGGRGKSSRSGSSKNSHNSSNHSNIPASSGSNSSNSSAHGNGSNSNQGSAKSRNSKSFKASQGKKPADAKTPKSQQSTPAQLANTSTQPTQTSSSSSSSQQTSTEEAANGSSAPAPFSGKKPVNKTSGGAKKGRGSFNNGYESNEGSNFSGSHHHASNGFHGNHHNNSHHHPHHSANGHHGHHSHHRGSGANGSSNSHTNSKYQFNNSFNPNSNRRMNSNHFTPKYYVHPEYNSAYNQMYSGNAMPVMYNDPVQFVVAQLDYYMCVENLCKDMYLRSHMSENGWISLSLLANFNRVRKLTHGDVNVVSEAARRLHDVEMSEDGSKIRPKQYAHWVLPIAERAPEAKEDDSHVVAKTITVIEPSKLVFNAANAVPFIPKSETAASATESSVSN